MKNYLVPILSVLLPITLLLVSSINLYSQTAPGRGYETITLHPGYDHTKWGIEPSDLVYYFAAYTTSFDGTDDNNSDGKDDVWGIPEWVAYEVKEEKNDGVDKYSRPKWLTDDELNKKGIVPNDATYAVSGTRKLKEVSGDYRYVRGHMCPKNAADRISMEAGYNTHTVLNAVPQLQWQNNGIWKSLEEQVTDWADKYGSVWVVCGPVFFGKTPAIWLGQETEVKAAIPDAIFKIIIRETEHGIETLAFIFPNVIPKSKKDYSEYITSIRRVEDLTSLSFLTSLDEDNRILEKEKHNKLTKAEKKVVLSEWMK